MVDGVGADVYEHEFLQALVEAGAEDDGGRDQEDEQDDADHRSTARAAASFGDRSVDSLAVGHVTPAYSWPPRSSSHSAPNPSGNPQNALTVCENTFSMEIRRALRTGLTPPPKTGQSRAEQSSI